MVDLGSVGSLSLLNFSSKYQHVMDRLGTLPLILGQSRQLQKRVLAAVVVCGTCTKISDLAPALRVAGRLDHVVTLPAPDSSERTMLLQAAFQDCQASASLKMLQVCSVPLHEGVRHLVHPRLMQM